METFLIIILCFMSLTMAFIAFLFAYFIYATFKPTLPIPFISNQFKDKITEDTRIPIEEFKPRAGMPIKIEKKG